MAYRYRSWDLGNNQRIVIRCEQDCVQVGPNGEDQFVNIKALNEWNPKVFLLQEQTSFHGFLLSFHRSAVDLIGERS